MQPWNVFHGKTNIHENNIKAKPKAISWRMHYQKKVLHNLLKYSRFQTFWSFLRPFERTLTLHKDSTGHIGFMFKEGKITAIVVESSAARNGLLIEHNLLEVNIVWVEL